jgi:hypothetical protein
MNIEEESQELYIQLKTAQQALDDVEKEGIEAKLLLVTALEVMKENPALSIQKAIISGYVKCTQ